MRRGRAFGALPSFPSSSGSRKPPGRRLAIQSVPARRRHYRRRTGGARRLTIPSPGLSQVHATESGRSAEQLPARQPSLRAPTPGRPCRTVTRIPCAPGPSTAAKPKVGLVSGAVHRLTVRLCACRPQVKARCRADWLARCVAGDVRCRPGPCARRGFFMIRAAASSAVAERSRSLTATRPRRPCQDRCPHFTAMLKVRSSPGGTPSRWPGLAASSAEAAQRLTPSRCCWAGRSVSAPAVLEGQQVLTCPHLLHPAARSWSILE